MLSNQNKTGTDILRFAECDNAVSAKALVEIINSIDCAKGHIEYRQSRHDWVNRLKDSITGIGIRRQDSIDANLVSALENLWNFAKNIQLNQTYLTKIATVLIDDIVLIQDNIALLGEKWLQINDELQEFKQDVTVQLQNMEREIRRLDTIQKAMLQLDALESKMKLGLYTYFTPPGQLYLAAAHLYYGSFRDAITRYPDTRSELCIIATERLGLALADTINANPASPQPWRIWQAKGQDFLEKEILNYLASPFDVALKPISMQIACPENCRANSIPIFISAKDLSVRVIDEIFAIVGA